MADLTEFALFIDTLVPPVIGACVVSVLTAATVCAVVTIFRWTFPRKD